MKITVLAIQALAATSACASLCVRPDDDLAAAVAQARTQPDKTVVFAPGDYFLKEPLRLGAADSGLVLRAERPGSVRLRGDLRLGGWRPDGDGLFAADVPGLREGHVDSRTLIVGGLFAPRAELPGGGNRFKMLNDPTNLVMRAPSEGFWNRPLTDEETRSLKYDPKDFPNGFDAVNAEVRVFHIWSESLCGVVSNVVSDSRIWFRKAIPPLGIWKRKDYIVYNTREGLREPGQWMLDRVRGKVVYRPRPGEDLAKLDVRLPVVERLIAARNARDITLDGLAFTGTTMPLMRAGFAGCDLPGAVDFEGKASGLKCERLTFSFLGGTGIKVRGADDGRLAECRFSDIGGVAAIFVGERSEFVSNRIERIGRASQSACGASVGGPKAHVWRNVLTDGPYSGFLTAGPEAVYEENRVSRVMRELSDGAAFYGSPHRCVFRNNLVEDVHTIKGGYDGCGFYNDCSGCDSIYENNVTMNVQLPVHMHMGRGHIVRNNLFVSPDKLRISFQSMSEGEFYGNRLRSGAPVTYLTPSGIRVWHDNFLFGPDGCRPEPKPEVRVEKDKSGLQVPSEVPGVRIGLDRDAEGHFHGGAPMNGDLWWDADGLHVRFLIVHHRDETNTCGSVWGTSDGVRLTVNGRNFDFFADECVKEKKSFGYRVKADLDWKRIGLSPAPGLHVPFQAVEYLSSRKDYRYFNAAAGRTEIILK